ncbi:16S rRNA (cytosine(967)-C(5))-methyltransferase RsmB [Paenactinomyces guangxiensis]|nr:16S rRNA (cytosine(967)-C(5))-methyltransferase RsmB [Paenactinomyces guangxiensis]
MAGKTAREWALDILLQVEQNQSYSNLLLNRALQISRLDQRDKRLVTELVYGSIQRLNTLDWILNQLVKKGIASLQPWVRQLLRLGIYQLVYLDKIPVRAAVHETVHIAKKRGHKGITSLVNGVLRSYLRQKEQLALPADPQTTSEKAIAYSHPEWLVKRLEQMVGAQAAKQIMEADNTPPKISVRVNTLKTDRDSFIRKWKEKQEGEAVPSEVVPDGVIIQGGGNPAYSSLYQQGFCTVQDESSMLVGRLLAPQPGMTVLDACAAPGGKTTHLAEQMNNQGLIIACDLHPHKIDLIRSNADRLGTAIVETKALDTRELPARLEQGFLFDAILLDAPCSGLGVIRRKPDIKWSKEAQQIDSLVRLQKELLDTVASLLRPGGTLLYSTCTWELRENSEQVGQFLQRHPEFEPDPEMNRLLPPIVRETALTGEGWVQILPHHFHSDGFFIARLIKKE